MENNIPKHWPEYSNLCSLLTTYEMYGFVYEDFYEVHTIIDYFSSIKFISEETLLVAKKLQETWTKIIETKNYSSDKIFIYLDLDFQLMLDNELKSFLVLLNNDLEKINYNQIESLSIDARRFPTHEEILERTQYLFQVLKHEKLI